MRSARGFILTVILTASIMPCVRADSDRAQALKDFDAEVSRMYEPSVLTDEAGYYESMMGEAESLVSLNDRIERTHFSDEKKAEKKNFEI